MLKQRFFIMAPDGEPPAAGATPPPAETVETLKATIAELQKKLDANPPKSPDLIDKAKELRQSNEDSAANQKRLEAALKFSMSAPEFLKQNGSLLPKEAGDIFALADKENYADAIEKDAAIKAGLIQSFFSVQSNVDLLTAAQKSALDDYLKLTKTGKQDKAQSTYDMIFEPAFETLKRVKRAEALTKGHVPDHSEDEYKKKMMAVSRKHFLGDKK